MIKQTLFVFIFILEGFIIADLLFRFLSKTTSDKLKAKSFHVLTEPLFRPAGFLLKHSAFGFLHYELSPYVTLAVLLYLQKLLLS